MKEPILLNIFCFLLVIPGLRGQDKTIDLAHDANNRKFHVKENQLFKITIENMIPSTTERPGVYVVFLEKKHHVPQPLKLDEYTRETDIKELQSINPFFCSDLDELIKEIGKAETEKIVKSKKKSLQKKLNEEPDTSCIEFVKEAKGIIEVTILTIPNNLIVEGEYLELFISREGTDGKKVSWIFTFDAGKKGEWISSYGFSFATHSFSNERAYFLAQQGDEFVITEEQDRKNLNFIPSIMFSYLKNNNQAWKFSLTGGLGIDTNKPTVFLGGSFFFNYNLGLTFGLVAHPQKNSLPGDMRQETYLWI